MPSRGCSAPYGARSGARQHGVRLGVVHERSAFASHVSGRSSFIAIQLTMHACCCDARSAPARAASRATARTRASSCDATRLCGSCTVTPSDRAASGRWRRAASATSRVADGSLDVAAAALARHPDPALVADELDAVRELVGHVHDDVARIVELDVDTRRARSRSCSSGTRPCPRSSIGPVSSMFMPQCAVSK